MSSSQQPPPPPPANKPLPTPFPSQFQPNSNPPPQQVSALDQSKDPQLLTLKVLRLQAPPQALRPLPTSTVNSTTQENASSDQNQQQLSSSSGTAKLHEQISGVDVLTLPGAQCNVFLGEYFSGRFTIVNEGTPPAFQSVTSNAATARMVSLKAEIQVNNSKYPIVDTFSRPLPALAHGQSVHIPFTHEFKEIGTNILVCSIGYAYDGFGGERQTSFRKFVKMITSSPVGVKTKFHNSTEGRVFLEIQLTNTSGGPLCIENMNFYPSDLYNYENLNFIATPTTGPSDEIGSKDGGSIPTTVDGLAENMPMLSLSESEPVVAARKEIAAATSGDESKSRSLFTEHPVFSKHYTAPADMRQYLYLLTPKDLADPITRASSVVGKLDIMWSTATGDHGRLQTAPLVRKTPPLDDLELTVLSVPNAVTLEVPFTVTCRIRNLSQGKVKLVVSAVKQKMGSVLLSGAANCSLSDLAPNAFADFSLEFFPLTPGLQVISGLKITDLISGHVREINALTDVFILHNGAVAVRA